jgi:hypothetical protein
MPSGITAILPNSVAGRGMTPRIEQCEVCNRDAERNRDCGKWYFADSTLLECVPVWVGKAFLCSDRCKSQHLYNLGTQDDRELLSALARFCHTWQEEGIAPDSHIWCVEHLHSGLAVDRVTLRMLHAGVEEMLRSLAGEGYSDGSDDPPQWFMEAVGMVETSVITDTPRKPLETVLAVLPHPVELVTAKVERL